MLNLNTITETPSELVQKRAAGMRAVKYDSGKHTISFEVGLIGSEAEDFVLFDVKRGVAMCSRLADGSLCESNQNGRMCSHVWAASKRLQTSVKQSRKAA